MDLKWCTVTLGRAEAGRSMRNLARCLRVIFRTGAPPERNTKCTGSCLSEGRKIAQSKRREIGGRQREIGIGNSAMGEGCKAARGLRREIVDQREKLTAGIVQWVSASLIVKARARSSMVRASGS